MSKLMIANPAIIISRDLHVKDTAIIISLGLLSVGACAPPARFPCDQGRDRRGGGGTWRMAPPRVREANAHQTAHQTDSPL